MWSRPASPSATPPCGGCSGACCSASSSLFPSGGAAIGAGLGAITGFFVKRGVDEDFQNRVRNLLTEKDEAAVFMVVNEMTEDKFVDAMRPFGGDVLQTSLSIKDEEELGRELGKVLTTSFRVNR